MTWLPCIKTLLFTVNLYGDVGTDRGAGGTAHTALSLRWGFPDLGGVIPLLIQFLGRNDILPGAEGDAEIASFTSLRVDGNATLDRFFCHHLDRRKK